MSEASAAGQIAPPSFSSRMYHREVLILVDYENLAIATAEARRIVDWKGLKAMCLKEFGRIRGTFVFLPPVSNLPELSKMFTELRFLIIVCPKVGHAGWEKEKDTVDFIMTTSAIEIFGQDRSLTDVIIVSNDGDFSHLATFFSDHGKRVAVFGYGKTSQALKGAVAEVWEIPTLEVPFER